MMQCFFFILLAPQTPSSNRSSLSNQFMMQKHKPVTLGNSSLFTEQSLSPLVTNSQSAPLGKSISFCSVCEYERNKSFRSDFKFFWILLDHTSKWLATENFIHVSLNFLDQLDCQIYVLLINWPSICLLKCPTIIITAIKMLDICYKCVYSCTYIPVYNICTYPITYIHVHI